MTFSQRYFELNVISRKFNMGDYGEGPKISTLYKYVLLYRSSTVSQKITRDLSMYFFFLKTVAQISHYKPVSIDFSEYLK